MSDKKKHTLDEAHLEFAKRINSRVWQLLEKPERTRQQDDEMQHAAHASLYHWLHAGTGLHQQRGEWLVARVHTVLGNAGAAVRHASRCLELTREHGKLMTDFDVAFAYEAMARAHALAGLGEEAREYIQSAQQAGESIVDEEDRTIFFGDFDGGEWYGTK